MKVNRRPGSALTMSGLDTPRSMRAMAALISLLGPSETEGFGAGENEGRGVRWLTGGFTWIESGAGAAADGGAGARRVGRGRGIEGGT